MQFVKSCVLFFVLVLVAQHTKAQANYMGSLIVDPYYGAPNLDRLLWETSGSGTNVTDYKSSGVGPFGARAEYMISDQFGLGLDIIFASIHTSYTEYLTVYNGVTDTFDSTRTEVDSKNRRLRVQLRFNYHFAVSNPNLDAYVGVGAGSNTRFNKTYENGVELKDDSNYYGIAVVPVSFRLSVGMRYYFSRIVGINAEIGLGGPLISAGLSFRL